MTASSLELFGVTQEEKEQLTRSRWRPLGHGTFHAVYCSENVITIRGYSSLWVMKYPFSNTGWFVASRDPLANSSLLIKKFLESKQDALIVCYGTRRYLVYNYPLYPTAEQEVKIKMSELSFTEETENAWKAYAFNTDKVYKLLFVNLEKILSFSRELLPKYLFDYVSPLDRACSERNVRYWNLINWNAVNKKAPAYLVDDSAWIAPYIREKLTPDDAVRKTLLDYYLVTGTIIPDGYVPANMRDGICIDTDWAVRRRADSPVSETLLEEATSAPEWESYHAFYARNWPQSCTLVRILLYLSQYVDYRDTTPQHLSREMMPLLLCFREAKEPITLDTLNVLLHQSALIWAVKQASIPCDLVKLMVQNHVCSLRQRDELGKNVLDYLKERFYTDNSAQMMWILFREIKTRPLSEQTELLSRQVSGYCKNIYQYILLFYPKLFERALSDLPYPFLLENEFLYSKRVHRCLTEVNFDSVLDLLRAYCSDFWYRAMGDKISLLETFRINMVCSDSAECIEKKMDKFCDECIKHATELQDMLRMQRTERGVDFFSPNTYFDQRVIDLRCSLSSFITSLSQQKEMLLDDSYILVASISTNRW